MAKKYQNKEYVLNKFSITELQLNRIIRTVKRRHPLELDWIVSRQGLNGQKTIYYCLELIDWISEVYLANGYYLDLEIKFYERLIHNIKNDSDDLILYKDMSIDEAMDYFNKDADGIRFAVRKMSIEYKDNLKYYMNDTLMIKAEGIKWLNEKYYRKSYLKFLERLKLRLDGNLYE